MDADYLKRTVGKELARGLAEVWTHSFFGATQGAHAARLQIVQRHPVDPIAYLSDFLFHIAQQRDRAAQVAMGLFCR